MLQKTFLFLLSVGVLLAVGYGCGDDNGTGTGGDAGVIMPLAVGNQWVILETEYKEDGTVDGIETIVISITGDTIINGEQGFFLRSSNNEFEDRIVANRADGLWDIGGTPELLLKYPATAGYEYPSEGETVTVTATDTSIIVPDGTYSCYCYRFESGGLISGFLYFAPDVGWVKNVDYLRQGQYVETIWELLEFSTGNNNSSDLVGDWAATVIEGSLDPNGGPLEVDGSVSTISFGEDGTYTWFLHAPPWYDVSGTGAYQYNGTTISVDGPIAQYLGVASINRAGGQDTFTFLDEDNDRWTYVKVQQ